MGIGAGARFFTRLLPAAGGTGAKAAAAKATAEGAKRFAAGPFMKQVLGIGLGTAGLGLASGIPGYRDKVIEDMISKPPGTDGYDRGPFGINNLLMLPSREDLDVKRTERLEDLFADQLELMRQGGFADQATVNPNKTDKQNRAKLSAFQTRSLAGVEDKIAQARYDSPMARLERANQDLKQQRVEAMQQLELDRNFQMRVDQLNERIDARQGEQAITRMQLANVQDLNREKLDVYRQQMVQKSADDRYRTTAGLISGLGTLAASFAM